MLHLLLTCWLIAGFTEGDTKHHYRMINSSFCIQAGKSPPLEVMAWTFDNRLILNNQNVIPTFKDKVVYNQADKSLCINNLTKRDNGIYKVSLVDDKYIVTSESHHLYVQETVPRPDIRISVISSNLSSAFCKITVNCSIQDDWMLSVCDEDGCRISQKSLSSVNITISAENRTVVCSASNEVSTSNVSKDMDAMCFRKSNLGQEDTQPPTTVILIVIVTVTVMALVAVCAFCIFIATRHFSKKNHRQARTSAPAQFIQSQPVEVESHPGPRLSTSSSSEADASYENVDATQPSQTSSPTIRMRQELSSTQSQTTDTVYSLLQAPNVTDSVGKRDNSKDTKGHRKNHEASTSHTFTLNEAQQPTQVDTVYRALEKPKVLSHSTISG